MIETIRRQTLHEEESKELMEPTMITGMQESEVQDRILMEKLEETDKRILALVAGQISLGARIASWEESTSFSHGKNP